MFDDIQNDQDGGKSRYGCDSWNIWRYRDESQTDCCGNQSRYGEGVKHVPARERERREIHRSAGKEHGRHVGVQRGLWGSHGSPDCRSDTYDSCDQYEVPVGEDGLKPTRSRCGWPERRMRSRPTTPRSRLQKRRQALRV